ncbi:MAG: hypothetical protein H6661_08600 [Ardenticatenaceae bacterium]|nr:hypothetical protein [Ardenticatenaceae bacterium]
MPWWLLERRHCFGALQAMKARALAGVVLISRQDATADGVNSIVKGELTVSSRKTSGTCRWR